MKLRIKRIYDSFDDNAGFRVLVDRIWPSGGSKESARVDLWAKELAPSSELRKWFSHTPAHFAEFKTRYRAELDANGDAQQLIARIKHHANVGLLYSAKDAEHNQAVVLQDYLA
jgi:uncharacterized protein YeaO (DUF488 family)